MVTDDDGHRRYLGQFYSEVAAAITYDNAVEELRGERPNERLGLLDANGDEVAS